MAKKIIVGVRKFCELIGVGVPTWYSYLKRGKVKYYNSEKKTINYEKTLQTIRKVCIKPSFYTDANIYKRRLKRGLIKDVDIKKESTRKTTKTLITKKVKKSNVTLSKQIKQKKDSIKQNVDISENVIEPTDTEFTNDMSRNEAETVKQIYLAKQAKIKYLKEINALTDTQKQIDLAVIIAVNVKKAVMAVPDRVSELYASMENGKEIKDDLKKELTFALSKLKFDLEIIE